MKRYSFRLDFIDEVLILLEDLVGEIASKTDNLIRLFQNLGDI
jgi:hypothetical protein